MRIFGYCHVSTVKNLETQVHQQKERVPELQDVRIVSGSISGGVAAMACPAFKNQLINKLEVGDRLVVLKLDPLGRLPLMLSRPSNT